MSELATALVEAQKQMPAVPKNATAEVKTRTGGSFSYSYVTLDSLIAKTLPVLNKNGLAITQAPEVIDGIGFGLRTTLHHTGGETVSNVMPIPHAGASMQDLGGAISYARRYAWSSLLGIASEHDDDAGSISDKSGGGTIGTPDGNPAAATQQKPAHVAAAASSSTDDPHGLRSARADAVSGTGPGDTKLTFGKWKDTAIKDVETDYLKWWISQPAPNNAAQKAQRADAELFLAGATADVAFEVPAGVGGGVDADDIPFARTFA